MYLNEHIRNIKPLSSLIIHECICKYEDIKCSSYFILIVLDGYSNNDVTDLKELLVNLFN